LLTSGCFFHFYDRHLDVDGKLVNLAPGMNLTAEIKTGKRRVIEYLLSPIQKAGSESEGAMMIDAAGEPVFQRGECELIALSGDLS
jgi:hypothetical protein